MEIEIKRQVAAVDEFSIKLNDFLTGAFNSILKLEEEVIKHANDIPLSVSELHLIEAIGRCKSPKNTVSDISAALRITMSSVTIAVNKLVKKGFAVKDRGTKDGRSVHITLTEQGRKMDEYHTFFHEQMVEHISSGLSEKDKSALMTGLEKLAEFLK